MSRIVLHPEVMKHDGQARRNARQPHVPSVKVTVINILRWPMKAKLWSRWPTPMIQDCTTNKPEVPQKQYGYHQHSDCDRKFCYHKPDDMRMDISRKGCEVSRNNVMTDPQIGWSKPPQQIYWIATMGTVCGKKEIREAASFRRTVSLRWFPEQPNLEDEIFLRGVGLWHPGFWNFLFPKTFLISFRICQLVWF